MIWVYMKICICPSSLNPPLKDFWGFPSKSYIVFILYHLINEAKSIPFWNNLHTLETAFLHKIHLMSRYLCKNFLASLKKVLQNARFKYSSTYVKEFIDKKSMKTALFSHYLHIHDNPNYELGVLVILGYGKLSS